MGKNILLIDDEKVICEVIGVLFTEEGHTVKTLPNADTLEEELRLFTPDIFILDYLMPGKNGAEITRYLRSRPDTKNIPIIMLSANQKYKKQAKKAGVNLFLNKPFDIYELSYVVTKLTEGDKKH